MEEKLGNIIVDGRIVDLDKISIEELEKIKKKLEKEEQEIRERIDKLLEG